MSAIIRLATGDDARRCAEIYRPAVEATPISFEVAPPDADEMRRRIEDTLRMYPWLVCEREGHVVGYAYAGSHRSRAAYRWSVDVAIYVDRAVHRQGVGTGLYTSLLRLLVAQGFVNACAGITLPNAASVALHESVGFRQVGIYRHVGYKLHAWHDVGWWHCALQPLPPDPPEPRPVHVLSRDAIRAGLG